jgi:hypothetical protein
VGRNLRHAVDGKTALKLELDVSAPGGATQITGALR